MNSLIKYGLYFVVAFSVLAFGAAEDGKDRSQRSEVGSQKGKSKRLKMIRRLRRLHGLVENKTVRRRLMEILTEVANDFKINKEARC